MRKTSEEKNPVEEFKEKWGEDTLDSILSKAGNHTMHLGSQPPPISDEEQRLYYSLLEMIDFDCHKKGCITDPPLDEVKVFLKENVDRIKCEIPSFIGLFSGSFDFLKE